jgi:hypothetical protein
MVIPDSAVGVAILIGLVIPGVMYAAVRLWLRGFRWTDQSVTNRIFDAVLVSIILDAIYLVFLGDELVQFLRTPQIMLADEPQEVGAYLLVLGIVVPSAIAFVLHFKPRYWWPKWGWANRRPLKHFKVPVGRETRYESTPTAWDKVVPKMGDTWVKVQLPDGRRVGGWMSGNSFVANYPQPRDLYIEEQFEVFADGSFGARIENTRGVWVTIPEQAIVEWLDPAPEDQAEEAA